MEDFDDFFSAEAPSVKNASVKKTIHNPTLHVDANPKINVLIADWLSDKQLKYVIRFFSRLTVDINLVYVFPFVADEKHMVKGIGKFFIDNVREDLKDFLKPNVPIITFGRAIYATTFDTDVQVSGFYDSVFNTPYFYSTFVDNRVYPIDSIFKLCAFGENDKKTGELIYFYDKWETHFAEEQVKRAVRAGNCSLPRKATLTFIKIKDTDAWFRQHTDYVPEQERWVGLDSETSGFNRLSDRIGNITISFDGFTAFYMDWADVNPRTFTAFMKAHRLVLANGKFDLLFFAYHGCDLCFLDWDTMIAGHLLNEMRSNSLKVQAFCYTNYGGYDLELEKYKMRYPGIVDYTKIPESVRMPYACMDAAVMMQVFRKQLGALKKEPELYAHYIDIVIPMVKVFTKAEYRGFCINWDKIDTVGEDLKVKINDCKKAVQTVLGDQTLDVNSKRDVGLLLEKRGWECINRTKAGHYKVSKTQMIEWKKLGHPEVTQLQEYSKWTAIWQTFIGAESTEDATVNFESEQDEVDSFFSEDVGGSFSSNDDTGLWKYRAADNRVHTTFHPFMANSHRHRSSDPNLQNIPKKNYDAAFMVRQCYDTPKIIECTADEAEEVWVYDKTSGVSRYPISEFYTLNRDSKTDGRLVYYKQSETFLFNILECDGENLQAKIAASLSRDPALVALFMKGGDFHSNNAYEIMAKYMLFGEYTLETSSGRKTVMEWDSFDLVRQSAEEKHVSPDHFLKGDTIDGIGEILSITVTERKISYTEYCDNAKKGRLKELRTTSKLIGFGLIFGMSATAFSGSTLRIEWTIDRCTEFIRMMNLGGLRNTLAEQYKRMPKGDLEYLTVATFFRKEFFKLYPVLEKWILDCAAVASIKGYVRSPWGSRRLLPQLTYKGKHADRAEVKNLSNIAVNSPVQDYETAYMAKAMIQSDKAFEDNGFKSYIAGTVHDSVVSFAFLEEQNEVLKILLDSFAVDYEQGLGIPYSGECNVADINAGETWGFGKREVKRKEVKDVVIRNRKIST